MGMGMGVGAFGIQHKRLGNRESHCVVEMVLRVEQKNLHSPPASAQSVAANTFSAEKANDNKINRDIGSNNKLFVKFFILSTDYCYLHSYITRPILHCVSLSVQLEPGVAPKLEQSEIDDMLSQALPALCLSCCCCWATYTVIETATTRRSTTTSPIVLEWVGCARKSKTRLIKPIQLE